MKKSVFFSVMFSLLSPIVVGAIVWLYYVFQSMANPFALLLQIQLAAISNAHIAGLAMACFVLPSYFWLTKKRSVSLIALYLIGLVGGAVFSLILINGYAQIHLINAFMAATSAAIFIVSLRRLSSCSIQRD